MNYTFAIRRNGVLKAISIYEYWPAITFTPKNMGLYDTKRGAKLRIALTVETFQNKIRNAKSRIARTKNQTPTKFSLTESQQRIDASKCVIARNERIIKQLQTEVLVVRVKKSKVKLLVAVYVTKYTIKE